MKKKIALLLAAVMTMSLMPTTIFATSGNKVNATLSSVPAKTALYSNSADAPFGIIDDTLAGANRTGTYDRVNTYSGKTIENRAQATSISIRPDAGQVLAPNSTFRLQLDSAKWMLTLASSKNGTTAAAIDLTAADFYNPAISAGKGTITYDSDAMGYTYTPKIPSVTGAATPSLLDVGYTFKVSTADETVATITINAPQYTADGALKNGQYSNQPYLTIPIPVYVEKEGVTVKAKITSSNSTVSTGEFVIVASSSGSTINSFKTIEAGRETITLGTLAIDETRIGSITESGGIRITAPAGYDFDNTPSNWVFLSETSGLSFSNVYYRSDASSDVYYIYFEGFTPSTSIPGSIYIKNMRIAPIDNDNIPVGKTLTMNLQRYSGSKTLKDWTLINVLAKSTDKAELDAQSALSNLTVGTGTVTQKELKISTGSINAAKAVDWAIAFTADTPTELIAGRYADYTESDEHVAAEVTFEEQEVGAWLANRTTEFTVPEGVKIRGVKYTTTDYFKTGYTPTDAVNDQLAGTDKVTSDGDYVESRLKQTKIVDLGDNGFDGGLGLVTYTEGKITFKNMSVQEGELAKLQFKLYLSIDPNYKKDTVELTASGTAIPDTIKPVVIAKVKRPITVTAKSTDVQIGYQKYAVADILITENLAGGIKKVGTGDKGLKVALYDGEVSSDMKFQNVVASQITTTGDIKITFDSVKEGVIFLDVDRVSSAPSSIKIADVEIKIDRTVPYGTYDIDVFGDSVFANYQTVDDKYHLSPIVGHNNFDDGFIMPGYIKVATEGTNTQKVNTFKVQDGSKTVIINGETSTIPVAPYISKASSRFMLPVRYMAVLLGVDEKDIVYSDATKTVTIMLPGRTVQFETGSDIMTIGSNGVTTQVKMDSKAENTDGRVYVPVKAVSEAYGAKLSYDDATKTATFN